VTKAVLSSVGKIIGVNPCEDKKCVMHGDVGSTKDTDFKNSDFCPACLKLFCAAVITRELWITPIGGFSGPNSQY
jgi:predicted Zn-dependent protease